MTPSSCAPAEPWRTRGADERHASLARGGQASPQGFAFVVDAVDPTTGARAGRFMTPHGTILTPAFMPVGTQATVKSLTPEELQALGAQIILSNTYHLHLRPGAEVIARFGGLHRFMGWPGPILTDSGGFQVFSLAHLRRLDDDGVTFRSHIDGSERRLTPEGAIAIQEQLGADVVMAFDECVEYPTTHERARQAMERTHRWAERCRRAQVRRDQALFGIVQGSVYDDLRRESARAIAALDLPGYAIGGVSVGESKSECWRITALVTALLPHERPRYLMGVGSPEDLAHGVGHGVDLFDSVLPTRLARNGALLTDGGRVMISRGVWRDHEGPLEAGCDCYTCAHYSAAYVHHLFKAEELLAYRLASIHNLRYLARLSARMREAILAGEFGAWRQAFLADYRVADEGARQEQREKRLAAWTVSRRRLDETTRLAEAGEGSDAPSSSGAGGGGGP
ncbi:MAG TPA: tRNA guanosine(34) transglycosylase Tgt [Chloroflexota bacterium]|nr:tRNA guanosine(34) transglycosylase Tgt [Chloroflexota bacterium]